ncbi:Uncharacterised protein [Mycobacteroides abscessus subsp. abscessus]|nr:Uncharacterised protein [Mycobacteroides abscessus subsp. abscessus]
MSTSNAWAAARSGSPTEHSTNEHTTASNRSSPVTARSSNTPAVTVTGIAAPAAASSACGRSRDSGSSAVTAVTVFG